MVHGLNEGHIEPYTDIEFQLAKYQTYIIMKYFMNELKAVNNPQTDQPYNGCHSRKSSFLTEFRSENIPCHDSNGVVIFMVNNAL